MGAHPDTVAKIADGSMNSMGVFLLQELARFNELIAVLRKSLTMLKRAIKGLVVMSSSLENMFNCFVFQLVPKSWEDVAYPSLKPLNSWVEDFFMRLNDVSDWL